MCGIAGILSLSPTATVQRDDLARMAAALYHRGPDDEGIYVDPAGRCGLAFRRLSIIDLAAGHQPMSNEDGRLHVAFNGEIYNFRDLRTELQAAGHAFRTGSDTETIVHGFEQFGFDVFRHLAGMFAIAIWSERTGTLVLARDRLGKKPLVCARVGDFLYFASEAKAILALPGVPREIDRAQLHAYLLFQYVPAPHSIYRDFWKIEPGTSVAFQAHTDAGPDAPTRRFWSVPTTARFDGTYDDAKQQLESLITKAVEKRLISDVPLGAFLSGGIDSSIVVALMRKLGVSPLRTFSIGFEEAAYDETRYAELVADRFQTEHRTFRVTPDAHAILETLAYHYDEPFADSSAIPTWYVSRHTREHVTVALTGDGGDECFAGYDRYRAAQMAGAFDRVPLGMRRALASAATWLPHGKPKTLGNRAYRFFTALAASPARRYLSWVNIFTPAQLLAGYRSDFLDSIELERPLDWFDRLYRESSGSAAERANRVDVQSYLPYDLLTKVDIASMACSLECRSPLLDHELIEFALSLPIEWKLDARGGKKILREWAKSLLPHEVLNRPKMGFGVPIGSWFRSELQPLLRERLLAPDALNLRIFRREWLERLIDEHVSGAANHEHPLWALFMLEQWSRRWQPTM
ncbi:MAG: asparagine synthase (glutamine-hydrolyzing) [Phycisphaerae bacterium]